MMEKPVKPRKPKKPKLSEPKREAVDHYYVWSTGWNPARYDFTAGSDVPMIEEDGELYPDSDYCQTSSIPLVDILAFVEKLGAKLEDVKIDNEIYYRESDGQLIIKVRRDVSDSAFDAEVTRNAAAMQQYEQDLAAYPAKLEAYQTAKKQYDIWVVEQKLKSLKNG